MGGVATLMTPRTVLLHTLLGHHHHINTGKGTHPGRTHRRLRTAGTLTRIAVGESHHGQCLVRTVGADITLDPRAEVDTVEAIGEDIIIAEAVEEVMVMEIAEEGLAMLHHIRAAATILAPTMEDTAQGAEAYREDAVEAEATELWLPIMTTFPFYFFSIICFYPYFLAPCVVLRDQIYETEIEFYALRATCVCRVQPRMILIMLAILAISRVQISVTWHFSSVFVIPKKWKCISPSGTFDNFSS